MWTRFKAFLAAHPNFRSALRVFIYTFGASFGASALGFIAEIQEWASGESMSFPSITPLGKAAASAFVSTLSATAAYLWNKNPRTPTAAYPEE